MSPHSLEVGGHPRETSAGANAFLACDFLVGYAVDGVEFHPRACSHDVEFRLHPRPWLACEVVGGLDTRQGQPCLVPPSDAPHLAYGVELQRLGAPFVGVDDATVTVATVFFGKMAGSLGQCLCPCYADADGYSHSLHDIFPQLFAPLLQFVVAHVGQEAETLVDGVAECAWRGLPDERHHPSCQLAVKLIVA